MRLVTIIYKNVHVIYIYVCSNLYEYDKIFHKVLVIVLILYQKIVITLNNSELLNSYITNNVKYFSYFENFLSALNSIHLLAHLLITIAILY